MAGRVAKLEMHVVSQFWLYKDGLFRCWVDYEIQLQEKSTDISVSKN